MLLFARNGHFSSFIHRTNHTPSHLLSIWGHPTLIICVLALVYQVVGVIPPPHWTLVTLSLVAMHIASFLQWKPFWFLIETIHTLIYSTGKIFHVHNFCRNFNLNYKEEDIFFVPIVQWYIVIYHLLENKSKHTKLLTFLS